MERAAHIDRYEQGPAAVRAALDGLTDADLDHRPMPGAWTAREVVHHLADSETQSYLRLRKLLAEDHPVLAGYDEQRWARQLRYDRPIDASLAVFDAVRAASTQLLRTLGGGDWERHGWHTESGAYSLDDWLRIYAAHAHDHAEQIRSASRGG